MKIAFIDHGFHERTRSNLFFLRFLQRHGSVDVFYDQSYKGAAPFAVDPVLNGDYELVVVFQMSTPAIQLAREIPERVVFVPMYDGSHNLPDHNWRDLRRVRILNFCRAMHTKVVELGLESICVQYFPEPSATMAKTDPETLRGFFWQRTQEIDLKVVLKLIGTTKFQSLNLHQAPDPGSEVLPVSILSQDTELHLSVSHWFEKHSDFQHLLESSNVFFASRPIEGIGMSFLEAMARGQCVVAPKTPTMSEYIDDRVCGLLYDLTNPTPLDFSDVSRMGAAARARIERGHHAWMNDLETLVPTFLFDARKKRRTLRSTAREVRRYIRNSISTGRT